MSHDIAIAHDQFRTMGGAERVACELARTFDAPIYTMRVDDGVPPEDVDIRELSGRAGKWVMRRHYLFQDAYQSLAWSHVSDLYEYDIIIENKTDPWWFVPRDNQTVVRYVHSPPRGMYDNFHNHGRSWLRRGLYTLQRLLYQQTIPYADAWACNSDLVAYRTQTYLGVDSDDLRVIYPPVDTDGLRPEAADTQEYYLTLGRLSHNKRVGEIIDAWEYLDDKKLLVAGEGPERDALEAHAPENVRFLGYVEEAEKPELLAGAKGFVMNARNEDFGMTPIEAMASGTPVIGVRDGFTEQQVVHGKNGVLFDAGVTNLVSAVREYERDGVAWPERGIAAFAERFSAGAFRSQIRELVDDAVAVTDDERTPDWSVGELEDVEVAVADGGDEP